MNLTKNISKKRLLALILLSLSLFLASCGGGGSSADPLSLLSDNKPVFTGSNTVSVMENIVDTGYVATVTDADADVITFRVTAGIDKDKFVIDVLSGKLTFKTNSFINNEATNNAPDFENPQDLVSVDNIYEVEITASDGLTNITKTIYVTIENNFFEGITTFAQTNIEIKLAENNATTWHTAIATNTKNSSIVYMIDTSYADASKFSINSDGSLTFNTAPDFEKQTDIDKNNKYEVMVKAMDLNNNVQEATQTTVIVQIIKEQPLIIIRIEFKDEEFALNNEMIWANKIFGTNDGQLNHYFNEISQGVFQFTKALESFGTNDGIITVKLAENHPNTSKDSFLTRIISAITTADSYIDFSIYDTNNNGSIDKSELQIMFIVAGGESSKGMNPGVWAHAWCMKGSNATAPILDGVKVMDCASGGYYSLLGEKHANNNDATIGIIAHELGHATFGIPDLYDTDDSSEGIGFFGLMGSGSWGYKYGEIAGETPVHMTGFAKILARFTYPIEITQTINGLNIIGTSYEGYRAYLSEGVSGEGFLIENRAGAGYDLGLYSLVGMSLGSVFPGGLLILHIDLDLINSGNTVNTNENHKLIDVEEANNPGLDYKTNRGHINNLFFSGNSTEFTPTSTPNSNRYDGHTSGFSITEIPSPGETMSVNITID